MIKYVAEPQRINILSKHEELALTEKADEGDVVGNKRAVHTQTIPT